MYVCQDDSSDLCWLSLIRSCMGPDSPDRTLINRLFKAQPRPVIWRADKMEKDTRLKLKCALSDDAMKEGSPTHNWAVD